MAIRVWIIVFRYRHKGGIMISDFLKNQSRETQGNLVLVIGLVLLASTLGIVRGLHYLIIAFSAAMIWYGFVEAGYWNWIRETIGKSKK
jgi:hypothetical protein